MKKYPRFTKSYASILNMFSIMSEMSRNIPLANFHPSSKVLYE